MFKRKYEKHTHNMTRVEYQAMTLRNAYVDLKRETIYLWMWRIFLALFIGSGIAVAIIVPIDGLHAWASHPQYNGPVGFWVTTIGLGLAFVGGPLMMRFHPSMVHEMWCKYDWAVEAVEQARKQLDLDIKEAQDRARGRK